MNAIDIITDILRDHGKAIIESKEEIEEIETAIEGLSVVVKRASSQAVDANYESSRAVVQSDLLKVRTDKLEDQVAMLQFLGFLFGAIYGLSILCLVYVLLLSR